MTDSYRDYAVQLAPPWLRGLRGAAFISGLGDVKDALVDTARQGVLMRFARRALPEALERIGRERGIAREQGESLESFRERVVAAWRTWSWAGTAYGVLTALRAAGYPQAMLAVVRGRLYSLDAEGHLVVVKLPAGSWSFEVNPQTFWSKLALVFHHAHGLPPGWVAGPPPEESEEMNRIRSLVRQWKPAHMTLGGIYICTSGEMWGYPVGTWGDGGIWGATSYGYHG